MKNKKTELNLDYLTQLSGGDQDFVHEFLGTYAEEVAAAIKQLQDPEVMKDLARFKGVIHQIKPTLEMVGLSDVSSKIRAFEEQETSVGSIPGFANSILPALSGSVREVRRLLALPDQSRS